MPLTASGKDGKTLNGSKPRGVEKNKKTKKIPEEFIKKIEKLGMKREDADILYKTKIDWAAMYSNNKIYCTETRCDFYTKIDSDELTKHMISYDFTWIIRFSGSRF